MARPRYHGAATSPTSSEFLDFKHVPRYNIYVYRVANNFPYRRPKEKRPDTFETFRHFFLSLFFSAREGSTCTFLPYRDVCLKKTRCEISSEFSVGCSTQTYVAFLRSKITIETSRRNTNIFLIAGILRLIMTANSFTLCTAFVLLSKSV